MEISIPELQEIIKRLNEITSILHRIEARPKDTPPVIIQESKKSNFLSVQNIMDYLNISRATIYNWVAVKKIPYYKFGSRVMFKKDEVDKWVIGKRVKPIG